MTIQKLNNSFARIYKNNGQHAEQVFRFTLTGKLEKADNISYDQKADCLDIQVKSARATVCKGYDIDSYLVNDRAVRYAYVVNDFKTAYIMSRNEWKTFIKVFGRLTRDSSKNGGTAKIRLGYETETMLEWLKNHSNG